MACRTNSSAIPLLAKAIRVCPTLLVVPVFLDPGPRLGGDELRIVSVVLVAMIAPVATADDFADAHRRLLERKDLQFTFTPPPVDPPPIRIGWLGDLFQALAPIFNVIFWGGLALGLAGLMYFIGREVWHARYGRDRTEEIPPAVQKTDYRPEPALARELLDDADQLAAQGRYEEAVRVLLHRSIADIEKRAPRSISRAQTTREIARLSVLSEAAGDAFAPLVRAVERSFFGGFQLGETDYRACRESYTRFALPEVWA